MVHIQKKKKKMKRETGQIDKVFHTLQISLLLSLEKWYFSFWSFLGIKGYSWSWNVAKSRTPHCLRGYLSLLDLSPLFYLSLSHAFYIYLNIGQKVIVAKRNLNCIIRSVACELEFLGTI